MTVFERAFPMTRRSVLKLLALLGLGGGEIARATSALAESEGRTEERGRNRCSAASITRCCSRR